MNKDRSSILTRCVVTDGNTKTSYTEIERRDVEEMVSEVEREMMSDEKREMMSDEKRSRSRDS